MRRTWITAHSGAERTRDNSLEFVADMLRMNIDVLELDVRKCSRKDAALVLSHDIADEYAVLLKDAFALITQHPTMRINCDLKEYGLEQDVLELAGKYQLRSRILFSGAVDPVNITADERAMILMNGEELIDRFYEKCKENPAQISSLIEELCIRCKELSIKILNLDERIIDDEVLEILHRYDMGLSVWTVDNPERQRYFLANQVVSMTTRCVSSALKKQLLFEQNFTWKPSDNQKDFAFHFSCPDQVKRLYFFFSFNPGLETSEEICIPQLEEALSLYYAEYERKVQPMDVKDFMPVKNMITLSLEHEGCYIGNAHRWDTRQEHIITTEQASRGFVPPESLVGEWSGMIHIHQIISPRCEGILRVIGDWE